MLDIDVDYDGTMAIVKVSGEATSQTASFFCQKLKEVLMKHHWVLLDLSGLTYICSGSMGCIIACVNRARQSGGKLLAYGVTDSVKRVFDSIKFSELAEVTHTNFADMEEAKQYMRELIHDADEL